MEYLTIITVASVTEEIAHWDFAQIVSGWRCWKPSYHSHKKRTKKIKNQLSSIIKISIYKNN